MVIMCNILEVNLRAFSELKTAPRGFDKEHPDVNLLRKKGFIASKKLYRSRSFITQFYSSS